MTNDSYRIVSDRDQLLIKNCIGWLESLSRINHPPEREVELLTKIAQAITELDCSALVQDEGLVVQIGPLENLWAMESYVASE